MKRVINATTDIELQSEITDLFNRTDALAKELRAFYKSFRPRVEDSYDSKYVDKLETFAFDAYHRVLNAGDQLFRLSQDI